VGTGVVKISLISLENRNAKIDELPSWKIAVQKWTKLPSWKIAVQKWTHYPAGKSQCENRRNYPAGKSQWEYAGTNFYLCWVK